MEPSRFRVTDAESPPSKREATAKPPASGPERLIVKVRTDGYVPPGFEVRTRIDGTIFTASASPEAIDRAATDPDVVSVASARPLRPN